MISWKGKKYNNETLSIDGVLNKEQFFFWKNYAENNHQKLVPDPFFIFFQWFEILINLASWEWNKISKNLKSTRIVRRTGR